VDGEEKTDLEHGESDDGVLATEQGVIDAVLDAPVACSVLEVVFVKGDPVAADFDGPGAIPGKEPRLGRGALHGEQEPEHDDNEEDGRGQDRTDHGGTENVVVAAFRR